MRLRQRQPRIHDDAHLDFIGRKFGRLTVMSYEGPIHNTTLWKVSCDCGTIKTVRRSNLLNQKSCGCLTRERMSKLTTTHGLTRPGQHHPLYAIWDGMKRRCHGQHASKKWYGERGIIVCDLWRFGEGGKTGFECFLADMGERPSPDHSIDRVNNNGDYEPSNCRWATQEEQQRNRSSNRRVMFRGREMILIEAIEMSGLHRQAVWGRLHRGWSVEDALTIQPKYRRSPNAPKTA